MGVLKTIGIVLVTIFLISIIVSAVWSFYITGLVIKPQIETITKYQCSNGQIVDSLDLCPTIQEKALIDSEVVEWVQDPYTAEVFYSVGLFNYGYTEARNVEIKCEVWATDEEGYHLYENPSLITTKKVGNIASTTFKTVDIYDDATTIWDDAVALCYPISCENCEIILKRIPEYQGWFE